MNTKGFSLNALFSNLTEDIRLVKAEADVTNPLVVPRGWLGMRVVEHDLVVYRVLAILAVSHNGSIISCHAQDADNVWDRPRTNRRGREMPGAPYWEHLPEKAGAFINPTQGQWAKHPGCPPEGKVRNYLVRIARVVRTADGNKLPAELSCQLDGQVCPKLEFNIEEPRVAEALLALMEESLHQVGRAKVNLQGVIAPEFRSRRNGREKRYRGRALGTFHEQERERDAMVVEEHHRLEMAVAETGGAPPAMGHAADAVADEAPDVMELASQMPELPAAQLQPEMVGVTDLSLPDDWEEGM